MSAPFRLGVLLSGGGTNLEAIIQAVEGGALPAKIAVVVSNKKDAYGIVRAREHGLLARFVDHKAYETREAFDTEVVRILRDAGCDLVVLAGFMRVLSPVLLEAFPDRVVNVHPALLPAFPGVHGAKQALDYGVKYTGCTVHLVDAGVDTGPIVAQAVVEVAADETEASLVAKIQRREHALFPEVLAWFAAGRITVVREASRRPRVVVAPDAQLPRARSAP